MTGSAGTVLVVEDDDLYVAMLAEHLGRAGHQVVTVNHLAAAEVLLGTRAFDAVIADLHLPGTDGGLPHSLIALAGMAPLIIITGSPSIDSALHSIENRVFAYRVKPFEIQAFLDTVDQAIAHGRLQTRMAGTRRRYQALDEQLNLLRQLLVTGQQAERGINQSLADYLRLLLASSGDSLAEAIDVLGTLEVDPLAQPVRHLSRHPEAEMFRSAVMETVATLEKTKNSFKSKELADLRRRLEAALLLAGNPRQ